MTHYHETPCQNICFEAPVGLALLPFQCEIGWTALHVLRRRVKELSCGDTGLDFIIGHHHTGPRPASCFSSTSCAVIVFFNVRFDTTYMISHTWTSLSEILFKYVWLCRHQLGHLGAHVLLLTADSRNLWCSWILLVFNPLHCKRSRDHWPSTPNVLAIWAPWQSLVAEASHGRAVAEGTEGEECGWKVSGDLWHFSKLRGRFVGRFPQ